MGVGKGSTGRSGVRAPLMFRAPKYLGRPLRKPKRQKAIKASKVKCGALVKRQNIWGQTEVHSGRIDINFEA